MTDKKELAKNNNAIAEKPAYMKQDTARGSENVGVEDLSIPRVDVIQALSPQRKKNDPAYIEGADEGILFNTITGRLYGPELIFIPVYFRKEYVIWKDRKAGGGFFGAFGSEAEANASIAQQSLDPSVHEVIETAQHFGLVVDDHTSSVPRIEEVVISMTKSKLKCSRTLNTVIRMAGGDRFEHAYMLQAVEVSGDQGSYFSFVTRQLGYVSKEVYDAAEEVYNAISGGVKDVNREN